MDVKLKLNQVGDAIGCWQLAECSKIAAVLRLVAGCNKAHFRIAPPMSSGSTLAVANIEQALVQEDKLMQSECDPVTPSILINVRLAYKR